MPKKKKIIIAIILVIVAISAGLYINKANPNTKNSQQNQQVDPATEAISIVRNLPEVREWINNFLTNKTDNSGQPIIIIDSEKNGIYTVHVYESLPTHTATFNWYEVNPKTKEVKSILNLKE